jgi:hypothetical protein
VKSLAALYPLARADVLERTRTFQYLAMVAVTLGVGALLVPPKSANYIVFAIDGYRGIYNSAWMGIMFALVMTSFISLFGYYLVKSAVQRDRDTRVGEIIASTSVGKFEYVLGKALSNFAVLASVAAILLVDAVIMQLVRGEDRSIDLLAIAWPIVVFVLPVLALVSALAVLFEVVPILRGGVGNVVYFFLWLGLLSSGAVGGKDGTGDAPLDAYGLSSIPHGVWQSLSRIDHRVKPSDISLITGAAHLNTQTFLFSGMTPSSAVLVQRLVLLLIALGIVAIAALTFDRFSSMNRVHKQRKPGVLSALAANLERAMTPLFDLLFSSSFGGLLLAELRLLLKGANFWWYAVALGLWIWTLFAPGGMQSMALGMAWVWPILIFSQLGTRESHYQTEQFVYPTLHPLRRQFAAQLCAGITLALALGSGAIFHDLASGNTGAILGVLTGAFFIPTLALACGALSGTTRVFEVLYLLLWYIGTMNATPLDYTKTAYATAFGAVTLALAGAAFYARRARLATA